MKVFTLDGIEHEWKMPSKVIQGNKRKTSSLHSKTKDILHELYPFLAVYEEVPIRTERNHNLYLDFYLKPLRLAIEVYGAQHYSFSSLFHATTMDFVLQKYNDGVKKEWCSINDINLLVLDYRETKYWKDFIKNYEYQRTD